MLKRYEDLKRKEMVSDPSPYRIAFGSIVLLWYRYLAQEYEVYRFSSTFIPNFTLLCLRVRIVQVVLANYVQQCVFREIFSVRMIMWIWTLFFVNMDVILFKVYSAKIQHVNANCYNYTIGMLISRLYCYFWLLYASSL